MVFFDLNLSIISKKMDFTFIHLTDIHGAFYAIHKIGKELKNANLVVLSGDISHFGKDKDVRQIIERITEYNKNIVAVAGNCDYKEADEYLTREGINLNKRIKTIRGFTLCGLGGSLPCPGPTPFEYKENEVKKWLKELETNITSSNPILFVTHEPPYNTNLDKLTDGRHVGSRSVRKFIEVMSPLLCLTGHIHEGEGVDKIGNCMLVNPGPFKTGKYASVRIIGVSSVHVNLKQITVH